MARGGTGIIWAGILLAGCGGGGDAGPDPNAPVMAKASPSGDNQSGPISTTLAAPLRVQVTQAGAPVAGRTVNWSVLASGGSASPSSTSTGADGVASTSITLPPFAATSQVAAVSNGVTGSPVLFSVISTGATNLLTIQVVNNAFQPANSELKAGGTVTFEWASGAGPHNVAPVPPNTIPVSTNPAPPATHSAPYSFSTVFPSPGVFAFFCEVHGTPNSGMRGSLTVVP
jgi:plastocyanin